MRFLNRSELRPRFEGKRVAVVGSGPGVLDNGWGYIDGFDVVVRVNNYKTSRAAGFRTDVFYSFFGRSIRKTAEELKRDGVTLCMSKIPDADCSGWLSSEWHRRHNQMIGVDYRPHFERRKEWWFCDTYVPTPEEFRAPFILLGRHIPTTGFAAIFDVLSFDPAAVYLTGFDFFRSGIHNVDERWRAGRPDDPIKHVPERELQWLAENVSKHPLSFDRALARHIASVKVRR